MNNFVMDMSDIYRFGDNLDGPLVVITGAVHGNETIGAEIIEKLKNSLPEKTIFGEIYLIVGNPKALKANTRFIDCDLNRLFANEPDATTYEGKRALEIMPFLKKADFLLDIHSTIKPSIPFIYCEDTGKHLEHAKLFGTQYIVSASSDFKPLDLVSSIDNFVDNSGGIGLTYESGWHKDNSTFAEVLLNTEKFLQTSGSVSPSVLPLRGKTNTVADKKSCIHLLIYKDIIPKTEDFSFTGNYKNFDFVKGGEKIAEDSGKPIIAEKDSYVIFPKENIRPGEIACYLASTNRETDPALINDPSRIQGKTHKNL